MIDYIVVFTDKYMKERDQMNEHFSQDFNFIVDQAKSIGKPVRAVVAGADVENILKGVFDAQEAGFIEPILVGNHKKIMDMVHRLGFEDRSFDLQPVADNTNVVQYAIDMILAKKADVLVRGNIQTRDFLMPVINKANHLLERNLMTHVAMVKVPDLDKMLYVSDVTITVKPSVESRKEIIRNMVLAMNTFGVENPNIAILSLVDRPSFHMRDTVEAQNIVLAHQSDPIDNCNLVGPIPYDLIVSKEAARLKGYDCPYCGEFDGILVPDLMSGNLIIKVLEAHAKANVCGIIVGAKVPIAITSRSDRPEQTFLSLAACAVLAHKKNL